MNRRDITITPKRLLSYSPPLAQPLLARVLSYGGGLRGGHRMKAWSLPLVVLFSPLVWVKPCLLRWIADSVFVVYLLHSFQEQCIQAGCSPLSLIVPSFYNPVLQILPPLIFLKQFSKVWITASLFFLTILKKYIYSIHIYSTSIISPEAKETQ